MAKYATDEYLLHCTNCDTRCAIRELVLCQLFHRCPNCNIPIYVSASDYSRKNYVEKNYTDDLNGRAPL